MSSTVPCENCGKIFSLDEHRRDKKCCCNLCSVKLNYAQRHNFLTPYQRHIGAELNYNDEEELSHSPPLITQMEEPKPVIKKNSDDTSLKILQEAENKLSEYKPYKN